MRKFEWGVCLLVVAGMVHFVLLLQMQQVLSRSTSFLPQQQVVHMRQSLDLPEFGTFMMWESEDLRLSQRYKMCLETFLKHNSERRLLIFSNSMARSEVADFVVAGYDIVVVRYNL